MFEKMCTSRYHSTDPREQAVREHARPPCLTFFGAASFRRTCLVLMMCFVVASCAASVRTVRSETESPLATISIIATTDLHGRLDALPWLGGYVRVLRDLRGKDGGAVLLVDAGDMWQGTLASNLTEGATVVRAYNALGYDAVAIGNHEFDFGPIGPQPVPRTTGDNPRGALEARAREARFPFLAANITDAEGRRWAPGNVRASRLVVAAGVKVGVVGVTTSYTPEAADTRNFVGLRFGPLADPVVAEARRLREDGAAFVVVLAHAGGRCDVWSDPSDLRGCDATAEVFALAKALPPGLVDVIAAGNTHEGVAHRVNGIAIVQAFSRGRAFARVDLQVHRATGALRDVRIYPPRMLCGVALLQLVSDHAADTCVTETYEGRKVVRAPELDRIIRPDLEHARAIRGRTLGVTAPRPAWNSYTAESPAGNLIVDLLRATRPASDVAIYHAGGTRASLEPGAITYGAMYDLLPFDSALAMATISAGQLADGIARALVRNVLPTVSGIRMVASCAGGTPHVSLFRADREIPPDEPLSVVTSEYLAFGGAVIFEGMSSAFTIDVSQPMRDAVIRALPAVRVALETGELGAFDETHPRVVVPGELPFHCAS
jgi:2',3'-cyclic-nucleotide 2'-phosphodiesterase (5'-nucleotidase family)